MAISKMAKYDVDMKRAREFVAKYNIQNITINAKTVAEVAPYSMAPYRYDTFMYDDYVTHTHVNMYSMEIPEGSFTNIIDRISEIDDLMTDPESARLIMEARFIYRLRHGTEK